MGYHSSHWNRTGRHGPPCFPAQGDQGIGTSPKKAQKLPAEEAVH